jgi:hypothetical protein
VLVARQLPHPHLQHHRQLAFLNLEGAGLQLVAIKQELAVELQVVIHLA